MTRSKTVHAAGAAGASGTAGVEGGPAAAASRRRIPPRALYVTAAAIVLVAGLGLAATLAMRPEGGIDLARLPDDESVMVSLAGSFPGPGSDRLATPLGIAIHRGRVYVAEADAGRIQVYDLRGACYGEIALPAAAGALTVYPTSIAVTGDGRLAVVDGAAGRVIVVSAKVGEASGALATLGEGEAATAPLQPTAVAYARGVFYVADGITHTVKRYDDDGRYLGESAAALRPALTYPGGLAVVGDALVISDSNAGRVLAVDVASDAAREFPNRYVLPRGLASVGDGVAVADVFARAVYVCDERGSRIRTIDEETVPGSPLESPEGVAWSARTKRLYVTDSSRGKVVVFNVRM